ncbi:hypothetical protein RRG08_013540 [Elysia crispata]|uniref:Uncharacterized protein n=1 Tax=Elysia crispata TaxID=231223 RepID=A0AAE0Y0X6_9GAST|nr:hypothetical protein RRG08_013540 [Elysia crispata]
MKLDVLSGSRSKWVGQRQGSRDSYIILPGITHDWSSFLARPVRVPDLSPTEEINLRNPVGGQCPPLVGRRDLLPSSVFPHISVLFYLVQPLESARFDNVSPPEIGSG